MARSLTGGWNDDRQSTRRRRWVLSDTALLMAGFHGPGDPRQLHLGQVSGPVRYVPPKFAGGAPDGEPYCDRKPFAARKPPYYVCNTTAIARTT